MSATTNTPNTWAAYVRQSKHREWRLLATAPSEGECWEKLFRANLPRHEKLVRQLASGDPNQERRPR